MVIVRREIMLREGKGKLVKVIRHNHQEKQNRRYIQQLYLPFQLVILRFSNKQGGKQRIQRYPDQRQIIQIPKIPADIYIRANVILHNLKVQPKDHQNGNAAQIVPCLLLNHSLVYGKAPCRNQPDMEQRADKVREQHIIRGVLIVVKPDHGGYHNDGSHSNPNGFIAFGFHFPPLLSENSY